MAKGRVFVDTNVIIESFRTRCWTAICEHYAIETVEKCIEEAMTGDPTDPRYVPVDPEVLGAGLAARHAVPKLDIATLALNVPQSQGLDDGELHLLAFLYRHGVSEDASIMVSTADKAAVVVAGLLGWARLSCSPRIAGREFWCDPCADRPFGRAPPCSMAR